jgi:predicted Zn-dependent peptidase
MKYCHSILICLLIALAPYVKVDAQGGADLFRVVKSSNGQSFILNTKGDAGTIYTDVYFRIGPIYEFDSLSGVSVLLARVINSHIDADLKANGKGQIKYYSSIEPEQIAFHFESGPADLDYIFNLVKDKIINPKIDDEGLEEAKTEVRDNIDNIKTGESFRREAAIMKRLWGNDFKKLNPYGDQQTYARLKAEDLITFHDHFFLPYNNMISVLGSFSDKEVLDKLVSIFKDFKSREFNPEQITKVIDFKPVLNTVQLLSTGSDKSMVSITYQNPGARQDRDATYSAYILAELINDKDGRIQRSFREAGLKEVRASYTCSNFYGTFVLSAQPDSNKFVDAFNRLNQLITDISQKNYFKEGEIEKAKKNIEIQYNNLKANNQKTYMSLVARFRFSNDENYITGFVDSINGTSIDHMRGYVTDYFTDHNGVRSLVTSKDSLESASPDQQYFVLDESISDTKFTYDLNKTDIETDEAKQNLQRLIQWLRINTDIHVQINGFSDEGEFMKSYDDSVLRFIDSTATFHKAMPDATKKGYLRIEFMRAMKIAKALYEAGIGEDRISGTSMAFTSDTKEAAAANRKCTLTLEKIQPRVSLYEYHFGKKKDEEQHN